MDAKPVTVHFTHCRAAQSEGHIIVEALVQSVVVGKRTQLIKFHNWEALLRSPTRCKIVPLGNIPLNKYPS